MSFLLPTVIFGYNNRRSGLALMKCEYGYSKMILDIWTHSATNSRLFVRLPTIEIHNMQ